MVEDKNARAVSAKLDIFAVMRRLLFILFIGSTTLAARANSDSTETCQMPGTCPPCRAAGSSSLAGTALGAAMIFGSVWLKKRGR